MAAKDSPTKLKLCYFNMRARAEGIRYLLAQAETPYEDYRVEGTWQEFKKETPFGTIPMLEVTCDGKTSKIGTSLAAARYIARYTKQYGSTPLEEALIDAIVDMSNDIREEAIKIYFAKGDTEKAEEKQKYLDAWIGTEDKKGKLACLQDQIRGDKWFMPGSKPTWADIHFFHGVEIGKKVSEADLLEKFPKLKALFEGVESLPNIVKWQKSRPDSSG